MYFEKLRIPPQNLWRVLTLSAILLLIYQHGPGWIHHIHRYSIEQNQIDHWKLYYEIHQSDPETFPLGLLYCEAWLSAHGVVLPEGKTMKDSYQKWSDIFTYWRGYRGEE